MMEQIKITDIDKIAKAQDYKHAGLYDAAGTCVVALNTAKIPLKQKISQIKKRLPGLPAGYYTLRFQHTIGKKYSVYDYLIKMGTVSEPPNVNTPARNAGNTEQVRGWDDALEDKKTIAELQAENARLKQIEKEYNEEMEEEDEEEEKPGLMENAASTAKEIIPQFLPAIDKWFEVKNRELDIREKELAIRTNPTPVQINAATLRAVHPYRPVPSPTDAQRYNEYCKWLSDLNDNDFNVEMNYIEGANPETFEAVKVSFQIVVQNKTNQA